VHHSNFNETLDSAIDDADGNDFCHIQINMRSFFLFYIKLSSDESMKSVHFEKVSYFLLSTNRMF